MNQFLLVALLVSCAACSEQSTVASTSVEEQTSAEFDSFPMANAEIREDVLVQLERHGIEHWLENEVTIRFRTGDADEVDRIVYEAIGVYAASQ